MLKSELRKIYLARQKLISVAERIEKSHRIAEQFFNFINLEQISFLHCFLPIEKFNEIDTTLIFRRLWQDFPGVVTLAPRVNFQTNEIDNLIFSAQTNLVPNAWQIPEPAHNDLIQTDKIDAVLIPLLSFDRRGFRVGYGKGFYDQFLEKCRRNCLKIGLSYFAPVKQITDAKNYDIKLDYCLTPEKTWQFV